MYCRLQMLVRSRAQLETCNEFAATCGVEDFNRDRRNRSQNRHSLCWRSGALLHRAFSAVLAGHMDRRLQGRRFKSRFRKCEWLYGFLAGWLDLGRNLCGAQPLSGRSTVGSRIAGVETEQRDLRFRGGSPSSIDTGVTGASRKRGIPPFRSGSASILIDANCNPCGCAKPTLAIV